MGKKFIDPANILLAFMIGAGTVLFVVGSIASFGLDRNNSITLSVFTAFFYAVIVFFLLKPKIIKEESPKREKVIEKQVIKVIEKIIEKPIIKKIIFERTKEKLKYVPKYVGSKETERFHKSSCKFAKLMKEKYKVKEDDKKYFTLRGYAPCKSCKP